VSILAQQFLASAVDFGKKLGCADHSPLDLLRMI
jgi:hypothetical protein